MPLCQPKGCEATTTFTGSVYLFKVNYGNNLTTWEICSELTLKTRSNVFRINLEQDLHIAVVFLLLTLNK